MSKFIVGVKWLFWGMLSGLICVPLGGPLWIGEKIFELGLYCAGRADRLMETG